MTVGHRLCWFCGKELEATYTSVNKAGLRLNVHYQCRPEAALVVLEDQPDYGETVDSERLPV